MYKKIDISNLPEQLSEDAAKEFIDHRINLKKPLTQGAFKRAMNAASGAPERLGMGADWAIEKTIDQGWQGINLDWLASHVPQAMPAIQNVTPIRQTRQITLEEELTDRSWAQ